MRVSVPLRAAAIPKAGPGTVIGVADVVDRGANLLARVALRAGRPADVVLPRGERCLVRAWSPYLRMQPAVVTPGDSGEVLLDVRKSPAGRPEAGRLPVGRPRSSSGWVQVWSRTADGGDWSLLDPHDAVRVDDAAAGRLVLSVAEHVAAGPLAIHVGGGRRSPVSTLALRGMSMTLAPAGHAYGAPQVEVRPTADSGFTLLEALRLGRMAYAETVAAAWPGAPREEASALFDLAVGYLRCRQEDVEGVVSWQDQVSTAAGTSADRLAIGAWLARRTESRGTYRDALAQLGAERRPPVASAGIDLLGSLLSRLPAGRGGARRTALEAFSPYIATARAGALTAYTAEDPSRPARAPSRNRRPDTEVIEFRMSRGEISLLRGGRAGLGMAALEPDLLLPIPRGGVLTDPVLIVTLEDADARWSLARWLVEAGIVAQVTVRNPHAFEIPLAGLREGLLAEALRQWSRDTPGGHRLRLTTDSRDREPLALVRGLESVVEASAQGDE
ncbi:hypothetical protein [Streptomyces sp. NBC_01233]|uniref:hypothetical protein n=1 Tax=Streptomyces sp. NBC_01233 TaxID=2903787 RepID=UPI002E152438|nr:hypothetical protein OG332_32005 [Streptomyces sp. NBC_01233]